MNATTRSRGARWSLLALRIGLVIVAGRLLLAAFVPLGVEIAARAYGFDVAWTRMRVHYLRGAFELDDLSVAIRAEKGRPANEPWLRVESVRADIAMRDLVRGDARVQRAMAVGIDLIAERRADGSIPLLEALQAATASDEPERAERPTPIHFESPVRVDELRVESLRLAVRDRFAHGQQVWRIDADLRADDLGYLDRIGRVDVRATGPDLVESIRVEAQIETRADDAALRVRTHVTGLRNHAIAPWVAEIARIAGIPGIEADPAVARLDIDKQFEARVRTAGSARDGLAGSIAVTGATVKTDGNVAVSLGAASIEITALRTTELRVAAIEVANGDWNVRRDEEGRPCALGFRSNAAHADEIVAADSATAPAATKSSPFQFHVAVDAVLLRSVGITLRDEVFEPTSEIRAVLDQASMGGIDTRATKGEPIRFECAGSVSGIMEKFHAQGVASPFADVKNLDLTLDVSGIAPTAIAPHLSELGLESRLKSGTFSARLIGAGRATRTGGIEGDLRATDVKFADGEIVFGLRAIEAIGIAIEPGESKFSVSDLTVRGTNLPLRRASDGSFAGLGLHTVRAQSSRRIAPTAMPSSSGAQPGPTVALPRIEIDRLAVVENRLHWRDETLQPTVEVVFDDCGVEITNLALFGDPARHERSVATVKAWSRAQDVVKDLAVSGTIATRPGVLDIAVEMTGKATGITALRLQPYIDPTGVEQRLQEASLSGSIALALVQAENGLRANFTARDVEFQNADASFTGAKLVRVKDALVAPERLDIASIEVVDGRLNVSRDPVGALLALGFRIPLSVFQAVEQSDAESSAPADASKAQHFLADLPDVRVGSLKVTNAELAWRDQAYTPPLETKARLDVDVQGFSTRPKEESKFTIAVGIGDTAEQIRVEGEATVRPGAALISARCDASGLRAGTLAPYLPPGVVCTLESGSLGFAGAIAVQDHDLGGLRGLIEVSGVSLREADAAQQLLALERFEWIVGRADVAAQIFEITRMNAAALELDVRRDVEGRIHACGFALGGGTQTSDAVNERGGAQLDEARVAAQGGPASGTREHDRTVEPALESDRSTPAFPDLTPTGTPRVVLDELDLNLKRLTLRDEARGTEPIELSGRVISLGGQVLVDADPARLKPISIGVQASAMPFAKSVIASFSASPWAEEPTLRAQFSAAGISGAGIDALGRDLSTWIDGTHLTDGVASGSIEAKLRWKRRSPLDLDFRGGIAADVEIGRCEFRDAPEGRVLVALDGGSAEIARIDPATGSVHVKTLELRKPEMRAGRTVDGGVEILGLVLHPEKRPQAVDAANDSASDSASEAGASAAPPSVAIAPATSPRPEFRIDEILVRGIDVEIRDEAASPPTVLPLVDLDVLVQRFTTRAFTEPRVIRFDAWLGAGKAEMPRPSRSSNVLSGIVGAFGDVVVGKTETHTLEQRLVFQEAVLSGRIQFMPELQGHAQANLSGLELLGFTGTASHEGVDIGDGTLDASVRVRFRGEEGMRVDSELVFSDLSLSEPKNGAVATYLTLPVPLDTALFLLENADGEHRIPVSFTLDEEGLTTGTITTAAAGAATSVLATAIASAPLRVLSTFTDLFGVTGGEEDPPPYSEFEYAPGSVEWTASDRDALDDLVRELRDDSDFIVQVQHRFGVGDIERAEVLSNPDPADCREIADGLRRRRAELTNRRSQLAAELRAAWGANDTAAIESDTQRLRALDIEAGNIEDAIDNVLELLKPGAERHRAKRTRSAALAVARQRIETLKQWFTAQGVSDIDERFEAKSPTFDVSAAGETGTILAVLRERP